MPRRFMIPRSHPFRILLQCLVGVAPGVAQTQTVSPLFTLGSEDGTSGVMLTRIGDVAVDRHGRIIVLDAGDKRLVVFRPSGERLQYLGRAGHGPGEFGSPMALAVTASDRLLVVDPENTRITEYSTRAPDSIRHVKDWPVPIRGYALCAAGSRVFALASSENRLIHELKLDGAEATTVRSFAEPRSHLKLSDSRF